METSALGIILIILDLICIGILVYLIPWKNKSFKEKMNIGKYAAAYSGAH